MEEYTLEELLYYKDLDFLVEQDENCNSDDERWEKIRPIAEKDFKEHKKCRNPEEFETKNDFEMYKSSLYTCEMYYEWEHPEIQKQIEEYENEHNDVNDEEEDFLFGTPKDLNINSFEDFKEEVKKILKEFKDLFTLLYIFDKMGCKDRSSEKGIPR